MIKRIIILFCFIFFSIQYSEAQSCTGLGQTPSTAFPVCGTKTFNQSSVPICGNTNLTVPGCSGALYQDKNPYWYKFTCYQTGTLGFLITPANLGDDYDWQLYDITNHNANEVYTNPALIVTGNWAGTYGATGASADGVNFIQCASDPTENRNSFASMPNLIAGHNYILMISHFTDSQSGYALSFSGGTADITDPLIPALVNASPSCDGSEIKIRFNKKVLCNSLAADGSDFTINIPGTSVISARGVCTSGFDMDTAIITINPPILTPGNYTVTSKTGSDGNTLLDYCGNLLPVNQSVPVVVVPIFPTLLDSITKPTCAPQKLELVFKKGIKCNSIAADGSDFTVTGPVPVTVSSVTGNCANGLSSKIFVTLSAPLQTGGTYTLTLKPGTDGGTLTDECNRITPPSSLVFNIKDTVNADFTYNILYGCVANSVSYHYPNKNGVNSWKWTIDSIRSSGLQNPVISYSDYKDQNTTLIVSNGFCSDTSSQKITFDNYLKADFEITNLVCPGDFATLKNNTIGKFITNWTWIFGNGNTSPLKDPPNQAYTNPDLGTIAKIPVLLIAHNSFGCNDTAVKYIQVVSNCFIAVPTAFTPNGDGINDYLYPLNAYKALDLKFSIYN
ncbi:MAG: PKD domain-containing protein, partial [Ferruginibacter sp.]